MYFYTHGLLSSGILVLVSSFNSPIPIFVVKLLEMVPKSDTLVLVSSSDILAKCTNRAGHNGVC